VKIKIRNQAKADLRAGRRFYSAQAAWLGDYFFDSLCADIDSLMVNAGIHPVWFGKYHRMLAHRFPFAIYYHMDEETVFVHAVLDCRQAPQRGSDRLSS